MSSKEARTSPDPITGASALTPEATASLLSGIIDQCDSRWVLFDLDSTLVDNRPRNACIMREFARQTDNQKLALATSEHFPDWSSRNSMKMLGVPEASIDQLIHPYEVFWEERFFTSNYCQYDTAINGAVRFVNAVVKAGGIVRYLTGRNETMRAGTQSSLQALGFPTPDQAHVELIMKPEAGDSDDHFKRSTLADLSRSTSILAGFDNEPTHINAYRDVFSDALCVHLDTDHSMRNVKLLDGIISIPEFCF